MILAFDIGTSVLKGALFHESGRLEGFASRDIGGSPAEGCREADTSAWKAAFSGIASELLSAAGDEETDKGSCDQRKRSYPCARGTERRTSSNRFMTWMDRRGVRQSDRIASVQDFRIDPSFYLPKALWIMEECPEVYGRTRYFLSCPESMAFWLTGEAVTILPGARFEKILLDPGNSWISWG